jgi:hypothetical protein
MDCVLSDAVAPAGAPLTERETSLLNPLTGATAMVLVPAAPPPVIATEAGFAAME